MIATFLPLLVALLASTTESCADGGSPRIVIGAWQLLERHRDESMAVETVKAYMAAGFEHFDTADIYGKSESLLGRAGAKHIYTKYVTSEASEANARAVNAQSRTALGVVPSLVQFHCRATARRRPDEPHTDLAGAALTPRLTRCTPLASHHLGRVGLVRSRLPAGRSPPTHAQERRAPRRGGRMQLRHGAPARARGGRGPAAHGEPGAGLATARHGVPLSPTECH